MITTYRGLYWINFSDVTTRGTKFFLIERVKTFYIFNLIRWISCVLKKEKYYSFKGIPVSIVKVRLRHKRDRYFGYTKRGLDFLYDNMFIILKQICLLSNGEIVQTVKYNEETKFDNDPKYYGIMSVYNIAGEYIGDPEFALFIANRKIKPEKAHSEHQVCSIGFCEKENKWYGWSHRAIYGFGIGSKISKGMCGFLPSNKQEFIDTHKTFFEDGVSNTTVSASRKGITVTSHAKKANGELVAYKNFTPFPKVWGRGEWEAKTIDDAKQMAIDFADDVS